MGIRKGSGGRIPVLQPPGAGLPWLERVIAKYVMFPRACTRISWAGAAQLFQEEGARILALWDAFPPRLLDERALIRRVRGIEDSSRYWSAAMTVEHLVTVGNGIRKVIDRLRFGMVPDRPVRIEDFKPRGGVAPPAVRKAFVKLLADVARDEAADPPVPRGDGLRYAHPWFGALDAYEWHCLLALHQRIHRRQVEAIRRRLAAA